jgi:heterodisulfide reductase subunit C
MLRIQFEGRDQLYDDAELEETCFQCSVCSLLCVVQNLKGYDSRRTFVYDLFRSRQPHAHPALWACSECHKCHEVCPQDVDPSRVIADLKEKSFEEGYAPAYVWNLMEMVLMTGMAFPITGKTLKEREKLGLPAQKPLPIDEILRIAELTGLLEKIERLRSRSWVFRSLSEGIRKSLAKGR